ncbi:hypothetical protein FXF51_05930 [Nonomuraea sp. PA05]|uniref:hypothetical protein n=1 Tax=Nonomuraea sp. PA05 TaxID=2604466 RepID=UPI0011DB4BD2|nr:hypothetical protein [Nonomuraea sp. PA05]TYB69699.1 hypothetical protein FXF51_05930 [Nonomuraea sp. PA05]
MALITDTPYGRNAVDALSAAVALERDFPGWLAATLATVAASQPHGSYDLTAGRPGSWEADLVRRLLAGTVGEDDEYLGMYREGGSDDE